MAVARKAKCEGIGSREKKRERADSPELRGGLKERRSKKGKLAQARPDEDPMEGSEAVSSIQGSSIQGSSVKGSMKGKKKNKRGAAGRSGSSRASKRGRTKARSSRGTSKGTSLPDEDGSVNWEEWSTEELLATYQDTKDYEPRDVLVERYLDEVTELARILHSRLPRSVDLDDLCTAGYSGLMRCVDTFDATKGKSFLSYIRLRVNGAMLDELRAMDWLPRLMRSRLAKRNRVAQELHQKYGRPPADSEIALALGVDMETYRRSYPSSSQQVSAGVFSGNEEELDRIEATIIDYIGHSEWEDELHTPWNRIYHQELMHRIEKLLSETEWALVELHYFEGLCLRDVAKRLGLSAARICQIHGKVLERLKDRLRGEGTSC